MIKRIKNKLTKKDYFCAPEARINKVNFGHKCNIAYGADLGDATIGKFSSIGRNTTIRKAIVGNFCSVSYNASIGAASHPMDRISGSAAFFNLNLDFVVIKKRLYIKTLLLVMVCGLDVTRL